MGKRHLHRGRDRGRHAARFRRFHVERIGGDQPHFRFWRAMADRGDAVSDALDLCAATTPVSLSGDVSYGLCATIHQTLLLSAMGVEIAVALALPRLGRDLFLTNSLIYITGLLVMSTGKVPALNNMSSIEGALFHIVGVGSIVAGGWLAMNLKKIYSEWKTVIWMGVMWALGVSFYFYMPLSGMTDPPMQWG